MGKYIIIDIDGVLNPFYARYSQLEGFTEYSAQKYSAFLNKELITSWFKKFKDADVNLVWGSAWFQESNLILEMLDMDEKWECIKISTEDVGLGTWKIKSIRGWVEDNTSPNDLLVWIDDELEEDAFLWAAERGNMLAIKPAKESGLGETDFQEIWDFLESRSE